MLIGVVAGLVAAVLYGAPAALQAHASRQLPTGRWWEVARAAMTDPVLVGVVCSDAAGAGFHYVAIQRLPLYLAQSLVATSLLFTALTSARLLHERLSRRQVGGLAAVCAGLVVLALGAGHPGDHGAPATVLAGLLVGAGLVAVLATACRRLGGSAGGVVYGVLAGACYGAVPVGVRLVVAPYLRWEVLLALVCLAVLGALGFGCYSLAMQRAAVTTSGAPLSVTEAVVPSVVGVAVFGDRLRAGWDPAVVVGVLLALAGIVAVARPPAAASAEAAPTGPERLTG
ncbi:MAG: EamA family transporter [Marmoricola sp.]